MLERMAWAEAQQQRINADNRRHLDLNDLPKFGGRWQRPLGASFTAMTPGLAVLVLSFAASVLATILRFQRYNPS